MDNRALFGGVALGAAIALTFDPDRGARRRALIRDKVVRGSRMTGRALDATGRDMSNRARGIIAATRTRVWSEDIDDDRLIERVRAKIGRVCSHPRAIDVEARDGEITLRGDVLAEEAGALLQQAASVPGVHSVQNELEPHESPEGVPSLQGEGRVAGSRLDLLQSNWAPATRALVGMAAVAAGGLALAYARR